MFFSLISCLFVSTGIIVTGAFTSGPGCSLLTSVSPDSSFQQAVYLYSRGVMVTGSFASGLGFSLLTSTFGRFSFSIGGSSSGLDIVTFGTGFDSSVFYFRCRDRFCLTLADRVFSLWFGFFFFCNFLEHGLLFCLFNRLA